MVLIIEELCIVESCFLVFKANNEKLSHKRVKSKNICGHSGGDFVAELSGGERYLSQI